MVTRTLRFAFVLAALASAALAAGSPVASAQQLEDRTTPATAGTNGSANQKARVSGADMSTGGGPASETTMTSLPHAAGSRRAPPTAAGGTGPGGVDVTKDLFQH